MDQYFLKKREEGKKDFVTSGNVTRTDKDLSVKEKFVVSDSETALRHGQKVFIRSVPSLYSIILTDYLIHVPSVAVAPTLTLPPVLTAGVGKIYVIKDASGSASATTITVNAREGDVINGDYSTTITSNFGSVRVYAGPGTTWFTY